MIPDPFSDESFHQKNPRIDFELHSHAPFPMNLGAGSVVSLLYCTLPEISHVSIMLRVLFIPSRVYFVSKSHV